MNIHQDDLARALYIIKDWPERVEHNTTVWDNTKGASIREQQVRNKWRERARLVTQLITPPQEGTTP